MTVADLRIRLKRHSDGSASLTRTRTDGTVTWQRQQAASGSCFRRMTGRTLPSSPS